MVALITKTLIHLTLFIMLFCYSTGGLLDDLNGDIAAMAKALKKLDDSTEKIIDNVTHLKQLISYSVEKVEDSDQVIKNIVQVDDIAQPPEKIEIEIVEDLVGDERNRNEL